MDGADVLLLVADNDQMRFHLFSEHTSVEGSLGELDGESFVITEKFGKYGNESFITVHDKDALGGAVQHTRVHVILIHEADEVLSRNPPEARSGDAKPPQLAGIETTDNGLLADFTDLRCFTCRKDCFHEVHPPFKSEHLPEAGV